MTAKLHDFDGGQFTLRQICVLVPRERDFTIRKHLAAGRNTTALMMQYNPKRRHVTGVSPDGSRLRSQGWKASGLAK